jgi:hypothetical protein
MYRADSRAHRNTNSSPDCEPNRRTFCIADCITNGRADSLIHSLTHSLTQSLLRRAHTGPVQWLIENITQMAQPSHELSVRISRLAESDAYVNKRYKNLVSSGGSHSLTAGLRMVASTATRAFASCFKAGRRKRPARAQHSVTEVTSTPSVITTDSQVQSPFNLTAWELTQSNECNHYTPDGTVLIL